MFLLSVQLLDDTLEVVVEVEENYRDEKDVEVLKGWRAPNELVGHEYDIVNCAQEQDIWVERESMCLQGLDSCIEEERGEYRDENEKCPLVDALDGNSFFVEEVKPWLSALEAPMLLCFHAV